MEKFLKRAAVSFLAAALLGVLYFFYVATHQAEFARADQLASLLENSVEVVAFADPTQFSDCEAQGPLPDPECTPGDIFEETTAEQTCVSGYSTTVRNVSVSTKKKIFASYGIAYPVPFGSYEIDHLVPLSLGGSNDIANLWPKSAEPFPGFYEKNIIGNYLRQEVCAGRVDLQIAQFRMANDWFSIYQNLNPEIIADLKNKYANWADRK